ncbi:hypothetical protein Ddye_027547 [Dipteronia dyeriana]|uniref:RNase H type-1 domain-containing protein n=1 Tax=Dipteronia dyeriana TaxID=168575 RepID=A0AAD9WRI8_9ROSI|nr:hypothetical protein Ddye_027547 [Dipteronia dyeriana]
MRNEVVFRGKNIGVSQVVDMVKFRMVWWFKHFGYGSKESIDILLLDLTKWCVDPRKMKNQAAEAWIPPRGNVLKFKVDGSSLGNPGSAGIGGILRDRWGKVLCMFSFNVGIQDSITAEVMAIHKAVDLCCSAQLCYGREIVFESDSKVAVLWINGKGIGNFSLVHFIYDIRRNLNLLDGEVKFKSRASNQFVDSLTKSGSNGGDDFVE